MKKSLKISLIILGVLVGIIVLDTMQALVFNNNAIIGIETKGMVRHGILVNTYHCGNGKNITRFRLSNYISESVCGKSVNISLTELEKIHTEVDKKLEEYEKTNGNKYTNVAATGVDQNLNMVVITLIGNSKEEQKWFRENIYDSKYITFEQGGPYTTSFDKVSLTIKTDTLSRKGATFILKNNSNDEYWYGPEYSIMQKVDDKWNEVKTITGDPLAWNTVLYTIKANEEVEINIDWYSSFGELSYGEYKLVKNNFRKKDSPDSRAYSVYTEFKIPVNAVAGTGNTIQVKKTAIQDTNKFNEYLKRDGITIYFASNIVEVYYNDVKKDMTLKYFIENVNQTTDNSIKEIARYLERKEIYKDGGSAVYRSKEYDITLVKCNNMFGNKDVYIGDYDMNTDGITMCSR